MKNTSGKFLARAVAEFIILAVILIIARHSIYNKIDTMLIDELKGAVAQQSQSISQALNGRFQQTLNELQARARLIQQNVISPEESLDKATIGNQIGRTRGILRQDNSAIVGQPLPKDLFQKLERTFVTEDFYLPCLLNLKAKLALFMNFIQTRRYRDFIKLQVSMAKAV